MASIVVGINNRIAERLAEINASLPRDVQITPKMLADAAEVSADFIYKLIRKERGCSSKVQFAIARVLRVRVDDIFMPQFSTESLKIDSREVS